MSFLNNNILNDSFANILKIAYNDEMRLYFLKNNGFNLYLHK